jgi:hypothetical protein
MRLAAVVLALVALLLPACGQHAGGTERVPTVVVPVAPGTAKIGIVTGTVSQGEDEVRAAELLKERYPGRVTHVTYPDNFMQEQDTTISQITGLASDPDVKVIILGQAVPGSIPAIRRIRQARNDILFGLVEPHENPVMVNEVADFAILPDQEARAGAIVKKLSEMGAKVLVHYSFPRHMSMELIARRKEKMEEACEKAGIEFVFVSAPDPMAEGGLPATQQFVLEDVPRQVRKYGKDVAFFSTNCGMQDPMIKAILQEGAMFAEPCCPSPNHGFPTALGISIPDGKEGDFGYINEQNAKEIAKRGLSGRFITWPVPANFASIQATAALLVDAAEGNADWKDPATVKRYFDEAAGAPVTLRKYDEEKGNFWLMLVDQIVY